MRLSRIRSPARQWIFSASLSGEQPDCPSLRALREHVLIVRPQRAEKDGLAVSLLFSVRARVARIPSNPLHRSPRERPRLPSTARIGRAPFLSCAFCEQRWSWPPPSVLLRPRVTFFKGWPGLVPYCARRTTTVSSWGFREHGEPTRPSLSPS